MSFRLYTIDNNYINYLKMYDSKVSHNYDHNVNKKPYVGIVYEDKDNHKFFAPLSSPKERHKRMSDFMVDCIKLDEGKLGVINLNNMIPVNDGFLKSIIIPSEEERENISKDEKEYIDLLVDQLKIINSTPTQKKIKRNANKMFNNQVSDRVKMRSTDIDKLLIANHNYNYIINNSILARKLARNELSINEHEPWIIKHNILDKNGNIVETKSTLMLDNGTLNINPDYNYAHLEDSMYQDMVDDIKKGEGKTNQLTTPNKTKDNDYER